MNLVGADYSNAHFAGGSDGHGGTLVTLNAIDDAPHFTGSPVAQSTSFSELEDTTGSPTADPAPAATGTIAFSDVDLTERPTATVAITDQTVTWLDADHATHLTLTAGETAALEQALTLQTTGQNNGTVGWSYSIADNALDFLGEGQTANVVSTLTLDDHQGKTDTAEVTVTITGKNDAPAITAETNDHSGADLPETNAGLAKQGTLTVSDADATDHVTVAVDHLDIYLDGVLQTDYVGEPSSATLLNYLSVQSGDILNGTATHSQFTWDFNSGSEAFDFLAAGHTLSLQYTIVPDDGHAPTGTGNVVITINIAGSNDAPTLDNATLGSVAGNDSNPGGSTVSDLLAGKFHDADDGASLKAIAVTSDAAAADRGRLAIRSRRHPSMGRYRIRQRHAGAGAGHRRAGPFRAGGRLHGHTGSARRPRLGRHLYRRHHEFSVDGDDRHHGDEHRRDGSCVGHGCHDRHERHRA